MYQLGTSLIEAAMHLKFHAIAITE
jgi:hypothetical protein